MDDQRHVLMVVLQNVTVRVDVAGTIRCCTVLQPWPGRTEPIVTLDGRPYPAPESVKEG